MCCWCLLLVCRCAGVYFQQAAGGEADTAASCKLVFGNPEIGRFTRGMLRTDTSKLSNPMVFP